MKNYTNTGQCTQCGKVVESPKKSPSKKEAYKKWEYRVETAFGYWLGDSLKPLGDEGWELVGFERYPTTNHESVYIFKRLKV